MPILDYNGTDVTHIIATADITKGVVTLVNGERYGVDHFWGQGAPTNWRRIVLNNNLARIMLPEEYPEPQFADRRLRSHKRFNQRRVLVIDTTATTRNQLKALAEMDDIIIKHLTFNRRASDDTVTGTQAYNYLKRISV